LLPGHIVSVFDRDLGRVALLALLDQNRVDLCGVWDSKDVVLADNE
jgi:hypothetical protein